ncbi:MAG: hypothetical protein DMG78_14855 [Acidobacteria bacterium]|nr:MAG: hypothetical protein DMG78_14855 [Acidobacteriota bacterium]
MMQLPKRGPHGSKKNLMRARRVNERVRELGKEYRATVPFDERSFRRWLEFVAAREPMLYPRGVEGTDLVYRASPRAKTPNPGGRAS